MNQSGRSSSLPGRCYSSPQDRKMNAKKGPAKEVISFHKAFWFVVIMQFGYFILLFSQAAFHTFEGKWKFDIQGKEALRGQVFLFILDTGKALLNVYQLSLCAFTNFFSQLYRISSFSDLLLPICCQKANHFQVISSFLFDFTQSARYRLISVW